MTARIFTIGIRDNRMNDRCITCIKRITYDWCGKYRENIHYCVHTCILNHPNCDRDHPRIKQKIKEYGLIKEVEQ